MSSIQNPGAQMLPAPPQQAPVAPQAPIADPYAQQGPLPQGNPMQSLLQIPRPNIVANMPAQANEAEELAAAPQFQQQAQGDVALDYQAMFGAGYDGSAREKEADALYNGYKHASNQAIQALQKGQQGEASALAGQASIDQQAAADLAPSFREHEQTVAKIAQDEQMAVQNAQQMTAQWKPKLDAAVNDLNNADFHSFWADKSTGARAVGVLAAFLGGAANGLAGNPGAPTPLDRVIDRDMQLQMQQMQKKQKDVDVIRGRLGDIRNQLGSDMAAMGAMRMAANNKMTAMLQEMANRVGGQKAPLLAQQAAAQLQQKNAMIGQQIIQSQFAGATQHMNTLLGIDQRKNEAARQQVEMAFKLQALRGKTEKNQISELQGEPLQGQSLDQLRNGLAAYKQLGQQFDSIAGSMNPIRNSQARSAASTALGTLEARGPRFSQAQRKGAEDQIGGFFTGSDAHNKDIMRQKGLDLYQQMRAQGNEPVPGSDIDKLFKQYGVYGAK